MKYEYKIIQVVGNIDSSTISKLNKYGADGWEVVAHQVYDCDLDGAAYYHAFTLKREC